MLISDNGNIKFHFFKLMLLWNIFVMVYLNCRLLAGSIVGSL